VCKKRGGADVRNFGDVIGGKRIGSLFFVSHLDISATERYSNFFSS